MNYSAAKRIAGLAACLIFMAVSSEAEAGLVGLVPIGQNETVFSLGIQFDFGDSQPEIVGSVRRTHTSAGNDVTGGKLDLAVPLLGDDGFKPTFRALGLLGTPDVQGEAGIGYDFATGQPLAGLGVQVPYGNAGVNFQMDGALHPYVGANTYKGAISIPAPPAW